ncbi:long-chain-fatty-acid--CoA ligase [Herpetosiphon llansteffanensis]|uniref:long-chain-fatty-acid--CoA ligase n=1 Tax=Herpetosiphon llansteffanensis TaxID=2094568 RepID=UPI000D7D139F|nr:long-chain fatty acid--CoA ligase [Herpetosiphon llansteffanensis]
MIPQTATTLNLATMLDDHARKRPNRTALIFNDMRFNYAQLNAMTNQIANGMLALGIKPGDHVALSCPNLPYFPMVYYAALKVGAVIICLNIMLKPREIAYHLNDCDAKAFFCFEGTAELPLGQMGKAGFDEAPNCEHMIVLTVNPAAPSPIEGVKTLGQLMYNQAPSFTTYPTKADDTAVIFYTSGTTGQPKGAELSHANMFFNAMVARDLAWPILDNSLDGSNVVLITLPLFHSTGQTAQMNANIFAGATLTLLPRFEPATVLAVMERDKVNLWTGVPTMFWALLQYIAANKIDPTPIAANLRLTSSGGAPMPVEVMRQFEEVFGVRVLEGYGLSECSPIATFNHIDLPSKPGTVGQAVWGVEVRCVDDAGNPVAAGEKGEILIRGHNVMKGYYKRPDATAAAIQDGWLYTGDVGTIDEDGYLSIVDRKKDMILRGGYNVYPREIEEVLMTHPAVSLVAVLGVPDEKLGEEVKAFIVKKPGAEATEEEVVAWCRDQFAAYKYPRIVEFHEQLPISATGKILKRELR